MLYQIKDESGRALDAHFEVEGNDLVFHSRGGTKGKDVRNLDYSTGLRLLLKRLQEGRVGMVGAWVDSARVQSVPLEERKILDENESGGSPESLLTLLSTRMKGIGRDPDAREGGGNPTKRLRLRLGLALSEEIIRNVLGGVLRYSPQIGQMFPVSTYVPDLRV